MVNRSKFSSIYLRTITLRKFSHTKKVEFKNLGNAIKKSSNSQKKSINWIQYPTDGIVRGSKNRKGWDKNWYQHAHSPIVSNTFTTSNLKIAATRFDFHVSQIPGIDKYPDSFQYAENNTLTNTWTHSLK